VPARMMQLMPLISSAVSSSPTAVTTAQLLDSLRFCVAPTRDDVLSACASRILTQISAFTAMNLVLLSESLAALSEQWTSPPALLAAIADNLDMKRYDLPQGELWRAQKALQSCSPRISFRLEERDLST
jgi:hypothetical protein